MSISISILTYLGAIASPHPRLRKEMACHNGNALEEGTAKITHIAAPLNWQIISCWDSATLGNSQTSHPRIL